MLNRNQTQHVTTNTVNSGLFFPVPKEGHPQRPWFQPVEQVVGWQSAPVLVGGKRETVPSHQTNPNHQAEAICLRIYIYICHLPLLVLKDICHWTDVSQFFSGRLGRGG